MSLFDRLKSLLPFSRSEPRTRGGLDAGGIGRGWSSTGIVRSLNNEISQSSHLISGRAAFYARNNANIASGINSMVANIVGTGIAPRSKHPDQKTRERLHDLWRKFNSTAGVNDETFDAVTALAVRQVIEVGESFIQFVDDPNKTIPFSLVQIDPAQVQKNFAYNQPPGNMIRESIEFSPIGRVVAYHVIPVNPNDNFLPISPSYTPIRVPEPDMVHVFKQLVPNQIRGLSGLSPVLSRVAELDSYQDAALSLAKTSSLYCGHVITNNDNAEDLAPGQAPDSDGGVDLSLEAGTISAAPPGTEVKFTDPPKDPNYIPYVKSHLEAIASGMGTSYAAVSGDYTGVNYSTQRAAMVETRRYWEQFQHHVLVPRLCSKVWARFCKSCAMAGLIGPEFFSNPEPFLNVEWLPAKFDFVDPVKDAQSEILMINAGLKARSMTVAELGYSCEELDATIAADDARAKELGLSFTAPVKLEPHQTPVDQSQGSPQTVQEAAQ